MNTQFGWYQAVLYKFKKGEVARLKGQFVIHRVFREDGLIHKLMKNPALLSFNGEEQDFMKQQAWDPVVAVRVFVLSGSSFNMGVRITR